jgi:hypothetical protein
MTKRIEHLLSSLREAIHDALGESNDVAAAVAELEREGHSPYFSVEVGLPERALTENEITDLKEGVERELPSLELVKRDGPLFLSECDEAFLRELGIAVFQ